MDHTVDDAQTDAEDVLGALKTLLDKAELKLKRETAELKMKQAMVAALPRDLPFAPRMLHGTGYKCDGAVVFEMTDRSQAVALLEKLPCVPATLLREKGGCTSFIPTRRFSSELKGNQRAQPIGGVMYRCDGFGGGHIAEEFTWWTELGDLLVRIDVKHAMRSAGGTIIRQEHKKLMGGRVQLCWVYAQAPAGSSIYWSGCTEENPGAITIYWEDASDLPSKMLSRTEHRRS